VRLMESTEHRFLIQRVVGPRRSDRVHLSRNSVRKTVGC